VLKDMFASLVMSGAMTSTVDFSKVVGIKSTGDDFAGIDRISLVTSTKVTSGSPSSRDGSCRWVG